MKVFTNVLIITFLIMGCKKKSITTTVFSKNDTTNIVGKYGNGVTDIDGNHYKTVIIGNQEWMAENLKVACFNDGTSIPYISDFTKWTNNTLGAYCYYNNDTLNNSSYGKLYNWYALDLSSNGNKNVCPTGWHVPSDNEWTILTDYLGGDSVAGGKMKETDLKHWKSPNSDATNTSLYNGVPGGHRSRYGNYGLIGYLGYWWSSSEDYSGIGWVRNLGNGGGQIFRNSYDNESGFSVRCLRD